MKHVIMVKLEIEAESFADAIDAVEAILDQGTFQDEINAAYGGSVAFVTSATCDGESAYRNAVLDEAINVVTTPVLISEVAALGPDVDRDDAPFVVLENKLRALKR